MTSISYNISIVLVSYSYISHLTRCVNPTFTYDKVINERLVLLSDCFSVYIKDNECLTGGVTAYHRCVSTYLGRTNRRMRNLRNNISSLNNPRTFYSQQYTHLEYMLQESCTARVAPLVSACQPGARLAHTVRQSNIYFTSTSTFIDWRFGRAV